MNARNALPQISPKRHPRYSPNLYKWLRKNKNIAGRIQVFVSSIDDTRWIGFCDDYGQFHGSSLMGVLCRDDCGQFHGSSLMGVLCRVEQVFAYCNKRFSESLTVIPDFWDRYVVDGRCAIDQAHTYAFVGDETRWHNTSDTTRDCLWCGKVTQRLETRLVTKKIKEWRNGG